ncbi:adenine phosphoribosyltransferase [Aurantiacibacter poecillastricola]|uniref:adenine phosphoribosyltransferase n=1 Tax=Aurantiacibacter poecillastricola TaxID=3064385 RepID=UPI00273E9503|nr:adenine phosphoribosyltransferase [Aurantiacibacter sp. 219JJ12-13]MDP5260411.1 adenine phosphoribosyltransferase [Aurantiacibacter sp. 219JJ12-13]
MSRDELKQLVRTVPDFPSSGIQFRDITTLLADSEGLAASVDLLAELAADLAVDKVAGIEARGFIYGTALALRLGTGFIPIRKAGKLPVECLEEDYALEYGEARVELDPSIVAQGERVLVVDDLLATGGTALAAARLLRRAGCEVTTALFVIDLPELGGGKALSEAGIEARALIHFAGH